MQAEGGGPGSLRVRNRRRVIGQLRARGVASQADIARRTGLSRATVSSIVSELRAEGVLIEAASFVGPHASSTGSTLSGRPPVMLRLHDSVGVVLGIDMGHSHVRTAVATLAH